MSNAQLGESRQLHLEVLDMINSVRQNHALEHATITLLMKRIDGNAKLIGHAGIAGFYLYGDVPTALVEQAAKDGLQFLQDGHEDLAISPLCGTNLVVTGVLTGIASLIAGTGSHGVGKLSNMIRASIIAAVVAQPLGMMVQRKFTTKVNVDNIGITGVIKSGKGKLTRHKILVARL